ncbi:hypothetical protein [Chamaesiphon sp. VAR_48_metabat_403]|uniref:hypothetical protein n=1 Tax=Chamaesiphon sp. VAR_48_metabat_403 TaxID=2964700 RepID=UPI00286E6CA0|nr:hypothetical protein [Chamaesiphon sp. VAR_48_metabat_403]
MAYREIKKNITILCLFLITSCGSSLSKISTEIDTQIDYNNSERIDLAKVGDSSWERVCIFGPYSNNNKAEQTLGFKWDLEKKAPVLSEGGVNVLAFVKGKEVSTHVEHPRHLSDFAQLSGQCFDRSNATLVRDITRKDNWVSFIIKK